MLVGGSDCDGHMDADTPISEIFAARMQPLADGGRAATAVATAALGLATAATTTGGISFMTVGPFECCRGEDEREVTRLGGPRP